MGAELEPKETGLWFTKLKQLVMEDWVMDNGD